MEFVTVYTTLNLADAELIRGELESANFTVNVKNEDAVLGTEAGVMLQVPEDQAEEARALLDSIAPSSAVALRDRALIALMVYTFARVGAALKKHVEDVYAQGRRTWVRLHEKGGKRHDMPCHHNLDTYLHAYIDGAQLAADEKGYLFRTAHGRTRILSERPMTQADAYRMIRRRAADAGIFTKIGNHSFRATGITECVFRRT